MPIGTPVTIGQGTPSTLSATTLALTTSVALAAGDKAINLAGWFSATVATVTFSGGALTWTTDSVVTNGSGRRALGWADAPAGLVISTSLTATWSAGVTSRYHQAMKVSGVATGAALSRISGTTGTTAWTSGLLSVTGGNLLVGGDYGNTTSATNTASGGNTEVHDQNLSADSCSTSCFQIPVGTGSIASSGTWTASQSNAALAVQFAVAGGAVAARVPTLTMIGVGV